MPILFSLKDPRGIKIECSRDQWERHVVFQRSYMRDRLDSVKEALANPDIGIFKDAQNPKRNIYYRLSKSKNLYMKVVVEFLDDGGTLVTAFQTGTTKNGEELIWTYSSR